MSETRACECDALRELAAWVSEHLDALEGDSGYDDEEVIESLRCIVSGNPGCTDESEYPPIRWQILRSLAASSVSGGHTEEATE